MAVEGGFTLRFGPTDEKNVFSDCLKRLYDKSGCIIIIIIIISIFVYSAIRS